MAAALDANPRVQMVASPTPLSHPEHIAALCSEPHKMGRSSAAIYGTQVLFNPQVQSKVFYPFCRFVYVVRGAASLGCVGYRPAESLRYYCFRLRRILEMASCTPGAVLLTWDDLRAGRGLDLVGSYLGLKEPLALPLAEAACPEVPPDVEAKAADRYEYYLYRLRRLPLLRPK